MGLITECLTFLLRHVLPGQLLRRGEAVHQFLSGDRRGGGGQGGRRCGGVTEVVLGGGKMISFFFFVQHKVKLL